MTPLESCRERKLPGQTGRTPASGQQETACRFTMTIPADPAVISAAIDRVTQVLAENDWPDEAVMAVELAVNEALANAIRHGCGSDVTKHVHCSVTCHESDEVVIVVRDPGSGFDPRTVADPLDPVNRLNPGGRGIFLIHRLMDHVQFLDSGREVRMRKRKEPGSGAPARNDQESR